MAQPQQNQNNPTQPCKFYGSAKGCRRGDSCYYSHNNPTSIPLCHYYLNCQNGNNCNFRHQIYTSDSNSTQELCTYFNSPNGCKFKDQCRFKHIKQERPELDSTIRFYSMKQLIEMKLNIPQRNWRNAIIESKTPDKQYTITIAQFNCLAQSLCYGVTDRVILRCPKKYLTWEYRCKRILYEILQYKPDVICLQEIDKIHFDSFYYRNLLSMQYDGIFLMKNNPNINNNNGHICLNDGIAIFWNKNKISYCNEKFNCILGDKNECCQVALGVRLRLNEYKHAIFDVWNTHLKAGRSNETEYKRVIQCNILKENMKKYSNGIPIIFCGDFNLHFDNLINSEGIVVNNSAYKLLTGENNDEMKENNNEKVNELMFKSLWNDKTNAFSCYGGWKDRDVKACFDYIMIGKWINDGNNEEKTDEFFVLKDVLNVWAEKEIEKFDCRLPNEIYSSDHFLIAVKVAIQINKQNEIEVVSGK